MRWICRTSSRTLWSATGLVFLWAAPGCSFRAGPAVNPFADDSIARSEWTSHSAQAVEAKAVPAAVRERGWEASSASYEAMGVPHYPLWWEDPFEDKGSADGQAAWTYEDYVAMPYSFGRYLLNTMGWPVSAIFTPPGAVMNSDGRLSRQALGFDHDAVRQSSWPVEARVVPAATRPAGP